MALGWEGECARECTATCFQTAAAKHPSALLAMDPAPSLANGCVLRVGGSWGHQPQGPQCSSAAHPVLPDAAHQPLHLPPSPLASGHVRFSSSTLVTGWQTWQSCTDVVTDMTWASAALQFRLSRSTKPSLIPSHVYGTSGHDARRRTTRVIGAALLPVPVQRAAL